MIMAVVKLLQSKLKDRVKNPIQKDERVSAIEYARKRKKAAQLYGEFKQSYSEYDKETKEYIAALNKANEIWDYDSQYSIDFESEQVQKTVPDTEEEEYYQGTVLKEEQEAVAAKQRAKAKLKKYSEFVGEKYDQDVLDKEIEQLKTTRQQQYEERKKIFSEEEQAEKDFYEKQLGEFQQEFIDVLSKKPLPVGIPQDRYTQQMQAWIEKNKDVLSRHYNKSVQIISGDIKLQPDQQTEADYLLNELTGFNTFKGGSSAYSEKILGSSPKYAYILPAGAPQAIGVPYFEGKYQEFDPVSFTITEKESKVQRWGRLGQPIIKENIVGTTQLKVSSPLVKEYVIQKNLPNWGFKGNFSADAAAIQKRQIQSKLKEASFGYDLTNAVAKFNASQKQTFAVISPKRTSKNIVSGSFKMSRNPYKL